MNSKNIEGEKSAGTGEKPVLARLSRVRLNYGNMAALDGVDLAIRQGERVCILGANGSGKSTLSQVLCGLLGPDEGSVELVGRHVCDDGTLDLDAYRLARRELGLVFQNPDDQIVTSVVADDVAFGPENLGLPREEIAARVDRELRRVALQDFAEKDPARLSGGQRQRVCIAGALALEPRLLVLDEPSASLDVRGREAILRVMGRLQAAGATLVHVTHFMDEALLASRVVVMSHGKIALDGTPNEVFCEKNAQVIEELGLELPFEMRLARAVAAVEGGEKGAAASVATEAAPGAAATSPSPRPATSTAPRPAPRPANAAPACAFEHVSFSYTPAEPALDDVSFCVAEGSQCALVGQTGSGKSTALRLLCGLEEADAGRILIGGKTARNKKERRQLRRQVGFVMQHPERQLFAPTVAEDVAFGPRNLGLKPAEVQDRVDRALAFVGLETKRDASPFELSGGQRRLAAIAGVLVMEPRVLVLDEPLAGLDPKGRRLVHQVLNQLRSQGITVICVTHSMEDAARADQVVVLDNRRVLFDDAPAQVFTRVNAPQLKAAGLGVPASLAHAWAHEDRTGQSLGEPLTLEALAQALASASAKEAARGL